MTAQATDAISSPWSELITAFPPQERTLASMLSRQADVFGDRTLYVFEDCEISFSEAMDIAGRGAATLGAAGVQVGDRVALMCGNRREFFEVFLGAAWLGAVVVPLNVAARGAQLQHMLSNSGARLLVTESGYLDRLDVLDQKALALESVLVIGSEEMPASTTVPAGHWIMEPTVLPAAKVLPSDPIAVLYTSGTTGVSKGVLCPHAQYFWWAFHNAQILELVEGDVLLTTLPLFHTNALSTFFQALLTGSTLAVEKRFSASGFLPSLERTGATVTYLLGAMVPILLSTPATPVDDKRRIRTILAPGVPSDAAETFSRRFGTTLIDGFATTETNFVIGSPRGEGRPGTIGRLRPGFQARVVDEFDNEMPPGTPGELVLRADEPFAFSTGYLGMPNKTVEAWRNFWLHTGDRVVRDEDGYFTFLDRIKDVIRRRGENISSYEVEQALIRHPAVQNAAAFPVGSELAEDEVMVAVVLQPGASLTAEELLDHCQPLISYFSVPRFVDFVTSLPVTENGKVKKFQLREQGRTPTTWDREEHGYVLTR
ncbi:ATP-dependent acyl-CoA ligase [Arthrobacter sp. 2MCAF14]|uniref:ATP-dependent acyl-CoA ligase n=1 Tax=Arthrobacter sp. 2MCAF14 TaxID=3232982 RepID=UPI003F91B591